MYNYNQRSNTYCGPETSYTLFNPHYNPINWGGFIPTVINK